MLVLLNMTMKLSNVKKKKKKGTTKCDKNTIRSYVDTAQYENRNVKCEKKKVPLNVAKV